MITIARFQQRFFIDLAKMVSDYGSVWVVEDGNVYRTEKQARDRCTDKTKLAIMNKEDETNLRYIRVDLKGFPFKKSEYAYNLKKIQEMFDDQEMARRRAVRNDAEAILNTKPALSMSDDEAFAHVESVNNGAAPEVTDASEMIKFGDSEFSLEDTRVALRETVDPKFSLRTGMVKTQAAVDALSQEDKEKVLAVLTK
jgi:hypothetical protein